MARNKDSLQQTLIVAFSLCLVCSVVVSAAAVMFKDRQVANKLAERNRNVLAAAGMYNGSESAAEIGSKFAEFQMKLVDVATGRYLSADEMAAQGIELGRYDQRKAAKDPVLGAAVPAAQDIASIKRQAKYAAVYVLQRGDKVERLVLPVHGYGLWSTLYGFLAVEGDGNTVSGLTFYEHGETPGLGGEVDNPKWKAQWPGKEIADQQGALALRVIKGKAANADQYTIDGLSGATLTSNGVNNLVQYWLGEQGFGPYLANFRAGAL